MSEETIGLIVFCTFIAGTFLGVYKLIQHTKKNVMENFKKLQQKYPNLQLSVDETGEYGTKKGNLLKGKIKEMACVCYGYITGSGDSTVHWTYIEIQHGLSLNDYQLRLLTEGIMSKMGKSINVVQEMEIGVMDFDKRFLIQSKNEQKTKSLLTMPIREKMMQVPKLYFGEININNTVLSYKIPYQIGNDKFFGYFEQGLEVGLDLLSELKK